MLRVMRKHARYFYVLFFIVILSFIFWGVGTNDQTGGVEIVAEVGKHKITTDEYWKTYERIYRFYREIYKETFDEEMEKKLNLKETVLDSMINERILLTAAKDQGITVSNDELQDAIAGDPAFMKNGFFDKSVYLNRLKLSRLTPEYFENMKRQELTLYKMRQLIELAVDVPDTNVVGAAENRQVTSLMNQSLLNEKREKAIQSYVEGLKNRTKIKINKDLIS